jgi:protein-disulfide isomerase
MMKKQTFITVIIIAIGIFGGTATGIWLSGGGRQIVTTNAEPPRTLSSVSAGSSDPQSRGPESAVVTLEEFADFQCPPCAALRPELKHLENEFGGKLRIIFRHYPLAMHKNAEAAAYASEAAGMQGKFWEMHDLLFDNQDRWAEVGDPRELYVGMAKSLDLDIVRFENDMRSAAVRERVKSDIARGDSIDIPGTPSLFLNGVEITEESMTVEGIRRKVAEAVSKK